MAISLKSDWAGGEKLYAEDLNDAMGDIEDALTGARDDVVIDGAMIGGTINNTVIGATTPAAGTFTTLSATSGLTVTGISKVASGSGSHPNSQGSYIKWNVEAGSGRFGFVNHRGTGLGGFEWYRTNDSTNGTYLMLLDTNGLDLKQSGYYFSRAGTPITQKVVAIGFNRTSNGSYTATFTGLTGLHGILVSCNNSATTTDGTGSSFVYFNFDFEYIGINMYHSSGDSRSLYENPAGLGNIGSASLSYTSKSGNQVTMSVSGLSGETMYVRAVGFGY